MARVRAAVQDIYTDADDKAMLDLGLGEINALYESWLEVEDLNKTISEQETEITRLNTELNPQKELFEKASKAVSEHKALTESHKKVVADLETVTIEKNTKQTELDELKGKLFKSKKKARHLDRKLKEASSRALAL
ncbi:uncharacterized protein LOC104905901 [Beta vulgaris subsp. vulgaris]|uniref:uncharacterized protein LOC104905901 n=1 Tax=Beta vulgaris subsp. vulgaris TaxID=3555 RepID=UPI00053F2D7D|nr:uncharacterized protein LOC104905901 [Beta vulgaris subsp. vulgaris]